MRRTRAGGSRRRGKAAGAILFHKADLIPAGGGTVAAEALDAIADTRRRVVGVVINEIDDALAGGLQADRRFSAAEISPLMTCLDAARTAGRVCVITSDHGHVVEYEVAYRTSGGRAQRWRPASDGTAEGEILLSGSRVLAEGGTIVAPWTERVRYTAGKSAGYHGGATPQEMLVPIAVFAPRGQGVPGWRAAAPAFPSWWDDDAPLLRPISTRASAAQDLLDPLLTQPAWIDELLASPLYLSQRERHARVAVEDERARRVLAGPSARGDRATNGAIAQALDLPEHRARGVVSGLRRCACRRRLRHARRRRRGHHSRSSVALATVWARLTHGVMSAVSPARRQSIIDALRRGTVPQQGLDAFAVGLRRFETADAEDSVKAGGALSRRCAASTAAARPSSPAGWRSARSAWASPPPRSRSRRRRRRSTASRRSIAGMSSASRRPRAGRGAPLRPRRLVLRSRTRTCSPRGASSRDDAAALVGRRTR